MESVYITKESVNTSLKELCLTDTVAKVVEFRHWMHQNAEGHLNEVNTHAKIRESLLALAGVQESQMKTCAGTGLTVDI
jgi:metal-dependent amidase/aminoacylase/carboxypeptidase family protein